MANPVAAMESNKKHSDSESETRMSVSIPEVSPKMRICTTCSMTFLWRGQKKKCDTCLQDEANATGGKKNVEPS